MKPSRLPVLFVIFTLVCGLGSTAHSAEFKKGKKVWSKHFETALLAEPSPLASVLFTVGFAEKLTIQEASGTWLLVKSKRGEGWVFTGNVAAQKPSLAPAAGMTTVEASETNTVAAARPLTPAAEGYAQRHGAEDANADIDWIDAEAAMITELDIIAYLVANQKGEYQE